MSKLKSLEKKYIKDIKSADVWSVFKIIADFVKGFDEFGELGPTVTVFGSARTNAEDEYYKKAVQLTGMLAKQGFNVMSGGGPGIMEAANKGAYEQGGVESIGLNIDLPFEQTGNPYTTKEQTFDYFFSRKVMLVKYSMAYVIFPGGFGTLDELFEALTLVQTKKVSNVKIFLVGTEFFQPLVDYMRSHLLKYGMIDEKDLELLELTDDLEYVCERIEDSLRVYVGELAESGMSNTQLYKLLKEHFEG